MALDYNALERTITKAIRDKGKFGIPFQFPSSPPITQGLSMWGQLHNLRGPNVPVTLGRNGEDEMRGIIQVDINYQHGKGEGLLLSKVTEVMRAFQAGDLINGLVQVYIDRSEASSTRIRGGYAVVSISIYYSLRAQRHV